jgi:hypothetical protein
VDVANKAPRITHGLGEQELCSFLLDEAKYPIGVDEGVDPVTPDVAANAALELLSKFDIHGAPVP